MSSKIHQLELFSPPEKLEGAEFEEFLKNLRSSVRALFAKNYENEQKIKKIYETCEARCESAEAAVFNMSRQLEFLVESMRAHG